MGHSIPVFFFPVGRDVTYAPGASWLDAQDIISEAIDADTVWQDTSRNWWHICLTLKLAEAFSLEGLDFLNHECVTVAHDELSRVDSSIEQLIAKVASGTPVVTLAGDYDYELIAALARRYAFDTAPSGRDGDEEDRSDVDGAALYFSFLRSLQAACRRASESGGNLLLAQPQP
jgi:hypothetical protein